MRFPYLFLLAAVLTAPACDRLRPSPAPESTKPDPFDVVRIAPVEPEDEDEGEENHRFDPEKMRRNLALRFPGLRSVDFLRAIIVPADPDGPCRTFISRPWELGLDLEWQVGGERSSASGVAALKAAGWWPTYRAPQGFGMERRAPFEAVDLTLGTVVTCVCEGRPDEGGSPGPVELRFRWGTGRMPEVSAVVTRDGKRRGLTPAITYGHELAYDFDVRGSFPGNHPARCGANVIVSILGDPPIL